MTKVSIDAGGGLWLITQITLLVLFYGNVFPSLPWWVVWFPTLLVLGILAIIGIGLVGVYIYARIRYSRW